MLALSQKDIDALNRNPQKKAEVIAAIQSQLEEIERAKEQEIGKNPFYMFSPPSGNLTETQRAFLRKWLKEDDIPTTVDGQLEALVDDHDIILVSGGNRSGKTTCGTIEDFIDITKEVPYPMQDFYPKEKIPRETPFHIRVVGVDNTQLLNTVLPIYRQWVPRQFLIKGSWEYSFSAEQRLLTLKKGSKLYGTIEFMTNAMDVEKFQGPEKHKINYDEEPRQDIYKENLFRLATAKRIRVRFRMTPTKGMSWVKDQIVDEEGKPGKSIRCFKLPTVINPKVELDVVEGILDSVTSYEERKMRLLGAFISLSGLVYGETFSRKKAEDGGHLVDPFPITRDYLVYRGGDPHLVKPSVFVELAVDREANKYVIGVYSGNRDTSEIKADLKERAKGWRLGQTRVDKSCNSTIKVLGDRNIFLELSRGENAIPSMVTSEKFTGSINAGVDVIKQELKNRKLFFFDTPEVWTLIKAMESLEREMGTNEDKKGVRDVIAEGRWDAHAAMRYIFQSSVNFIPEQQGTPEYEPESYI